VRREHEPVQHQEDGGARSCARSGRVSQR
jgi:hypothetical protein